jgi:hypothetical protein
MGILHINNKGRHVNTVEKYHNYRFKKQNMQLNETFTDNANLVLVLL